jgi:Kef-type K+ transport system membrane component KefB
LREKILMETIFSTIEFQLSLLLFVALAGYLVASRINQSAVIGEILVGLLVGPSLLGLITYTDFVSSLAQLGAVILLFVIGFEFEVKDILNTKYAVIALFGVIVPWIGGFLTAEAFGFNSGTAIFVGTALTATSIAITANVLREMGKLQTGAARAIIGAAVIDDVLGLLALAISGNIVAGTLTAGAVAFVIIKAVLFLVVGGAFGVLVLGKILVRMDKTPITGKYPECPFIFAMMIAFLYAMFASLVGLSPIVGAFIAGVSLGGVNLCHGKSLREGADYLQIIFASIFFVSLGILIDVHTLTGEILLFLVVISVVAILTKLAGCGIPARIMGMNAKDSLIVGIGMAPRGEVAMIVALIGLNQAIISQGIYAALVMMSLITTVITPIIYRNWLFRKTPELAVPEK